MHRKLKELFVLDLLSMAPVVHQLRGCDGCINGAGVGSAGRAMIDAVLKGYPKNVLEWKGIKRLAKA